MLKLDLYKDNKQKWVGKAHRASTPQEELQAVKNAERGGNSFLQRRAHQFVI